MPEPLQAMANETFLTFKHPIQPRRFALALFFALILFPLIAAGLVAGTVVLIVPVFAFLLWMGGRIMYARFMGNSILVSELNYPRIHRIGEDLKDAIRYDKPVTVFVYEQGNFNASLYKFLFYRRAVFLNSELLEAGVTDDELRWLIGRFIGYLRARRQAGFWGWTIRAAQRMLVFNLFLLPYERALVYTGDRIALAVIGGDITTAISAMQKLLVGRPLGYSVNPNGIVAQHRQVKGSIFAFFARLAMGFPHTTARYVDLIGFAKERFPVQFERFESENPGLPADLRQLTALPQASAAQPAKKDPVWASLIGAIVFIAVLVLLAVKVFIPQLSDFHPYSPTPYAWEETGTNSASGETSNTDPSTATSSAQPYISTEGRFSALFPSEPTQSTDQVSLSDSVSMTLFQFRLLDANSVYLVLYSDYPADYIPAEPQLFLEPIRNEFVKSSKGTLTNDEPIDLSGTPGRAFNFTNTEGRTYFVRTFLDGQRLYQVIVNIPSDSSTTQAEDFLNSFHIGDGPR
jgi:hypothetical protein